MVYQTRFNLNQEIPEDLIKELEAGIEQFFYDHKIVLSIITTKAQPMANPDYYRGVC